MPTECRPTTMLFAPVERRRLAPDFDGGSITSDAGGLLLGRRIGRSGWWIGSLLALSMPGYRNGSNTRWRRWWGSGCLGSRWATRT